VSLSFEWSRTKSHVNRKKHGIAFEEAAEVFGDPMHINVYDEKHSSLNEDRYIAIGHIRSGRLVLVVYTMISEDVNRLISARFAKRSEEVMYSEKNDFR